MDQVAAAIVTRKLQCEPKRCPHLACHNRDVVDHNLNRSLGIANPRPATTWEPEVMRVEMVMRREQSVMVSLLQRYIDRQGPSAATQPVMPFPQWTPTTFRFRGRPERGPA
jgi:hypothetical protein